MNSDHAAEQYRALMDGLNAPPPPEPPPVRAPRPVAIPMPPAGIDWWAVLRNLAVPIVVVLVVLGTYLLYLATH